jgi:hypothetical protein
MTKADPAEAPRRLGDAGLTPADLAQLCNELLIVAESWEAADDAAPRLVDLLRRAEDAIRRLARGA